MKPMSLWMHERTKVSPRSLFFHRNLSVNLPATSSCCADIASIPACCRAQILNDRVAPGFFRTNPVISA